MQGSCARLHVRKTPPSQISTYVHAYLPSKIPRSRFLLSTRSNLLIPYIPFKSDMGSCCGKPSKEELGGYRLDETAAQPLTSGKAAGSRGGPANKEAMLDAAEKRRK